jgi:hypothetical protein
MENAERKGQKGNGGWMLHENSDNWASKVAIEKDVGKGILQQAEYSRFDPPG